MKKSESPSRLDQLLFLKERYSDHIGKTLTVITDSVEQKRACISNISIRAAMLKQNREKTLLKIRVTEKNNIIYKLNIVRVRREISSLLTNAKKIKDDYDTLLKGPVSEIVSFTEESAPNEPESGIDETGSVTENYPVDDDTLNLIDLEKKSFLNSIDTLFQQYEEKIEELNREKKEYTMELEKLKNKASVSKKKRRFFYTIQQTYRDEIESLNMQVKKELNDLKKLEGVLEEIIIRLRFSSRLDEKARPLFITTSYRSA